MKKQKILIISALIISTTMIYGNELSLQNGNTVEFNNYLPAKIANIYSTETLLEALNNPGPMSMTDSFTLSPSISLQYNKELGSLLIFLETQESDFPLISPSIMTNTPVPCLDFLNLQKQASLILWWCRNAPYNKEDISPELFNVLIRTPVNLVAVINNHGNVLKAQVSLNYARDLTLTPRIRFRYPILINQYEITPGIRDRKDLNYFMNSFMYPVILEDPISEEKTEAGRLLELLLN